MAQAFGEDCAGKWTDAATEQSMAISRTSSLSIEALVVLAACSTSARVPELFSASAILTPLRRGSVVTDPLNTGLLGCLLNMKWGVGMLVVETIGGVDARAFG